ncbi:MAG: site-specific integrase [Burkholderiaceae bacterium]|nr:site-specific integrase [Burkholderiaceae bacterium]
MNRQFRFSKKLIDALPPHSAESRSREAEYSDTEVAGLRLLVNRLGRKFFYFRYTFGGKRSMKLGDYGVIDIAQARQRALDCRSQLASGIDPQESKAVTLPEAKPLTFAEFVMQDYLPHAKAAKKSWRDDESRLRTHLLGPFGALPLACIKSIAVQQLHDKLKTQSSPATANRVLSLLKRCLNLAILWSKLEKNPVKGIRMHVEDNQRQRYLSGIELRNFLVALDKAPSQDIADVFRFLLCTGLRREECLTLKWVYVDLEAQSLYLPTTKTGSRFVVLNDTAIELLKRRPHAPDCPFVFSRKWPGKNGEKDSWKPIRNPDKAFRKILKSCQINNFKIHDIRHSFASMAINNGASLYDVKSLLGHSDVKTTTRYAHVSPTRLRDASAQVSAAIAFSQRGEIPPQ